MKEILLATTNSRKVKDARDGLKVFAIGVRPVSITIDEIQHLEPEEVAKAKARSAYTVVQSR